MGPLLLQTLPVAVVIALEPICVIATLVMTATNRPIANGSAYLAALIAVMLGYGAVVLLVLHHHALAAGSRTDDIVQVLWVLIGLGFLAAFAVVLLRRPRPAEASHEARWIHWVERLGPIGAAGIGVFLVNWEMETPALTDILKARVTLATAFAVLIIFVAVAVSTSVAPFAAYLAAPDRASGMLSDGKVWLSRHQRPIMLVLFGLIGTLYTFKGVTALLAH